MEEFIKKFQSYAGLMEIIRGMDTADILSAAAEMFETPKEDLGSIEIDALGDDRNKRVYIYVLQTIKKEKVYFERLYDWFTDEASKNILFNILKYWILPDPAFLQDAIDTEAEETINRIPIISCTVDEIKNHIQIIQNMKSGESVELHLSMALTDIPVATALLSALREDLSYAIRMDDIQTVILYAGISLPKMFRLKKNTDHLRVASIAKAPGEWTNEQLLKDKGLVPFLLHRDQGYDAKMIGIDNGNYSYLKDHLTGMKMEYLPDGSPEKKYEWITLHAKEIDILIVNGPYPVNIEITGIYKRLNPGGLTYMPLDANVDWMDRIPHANEYFRRMLENIDVLGTSGRRMQEHLNQKWPWPVEYFPNGFFHPWIDVQEPDYGKKENVLLTVGRLGTDQKATGVMLEAFAKAADKIPDWKLRLIGGIEPAFEKSKRTFFDEHAELRDRVVFTGKITDKTELFNEYRKAKIFTLTSRLEGGTPNVIAEALHCGCAIATTRFDAYEDAIGYGKCGMSADIGDIDGISEMYVEMCRNETRLQDMCIHAFKYAEMHFSMEKVVARINESLSEVI